MIMTKIVYAPFPYLDEQNSRNRPLLVLAENQDEYETIIVAYITSKMGKKILESDFVLSSNDEFFEKTGLNKDFIIRLHKLGCIQKSTIQFEVGNLPKNATLEIRKKLKNLLNLN